jgi:alkylation response protein AidB-like acyl-CoA dehydrogenase
VSEAVLDTHLDETAFAALKEEIAAWVRGPGEAWAERIESERAVSPDLRAELREHGWLSLAGPVAYGGRGIPFSRYLELLELFSMSHASVRMIVHVANGVWRAMDQFATDEQRALRQARGHRRPHGRLHPDRADRRHRRRSALHGRP